MAADQKPAPSPAMAMLEQLVLDVADLRRANARMLALLEQLVAGGAVAAGAPAPAQPPSQGGPPEGSIASAEDLDSKYGNPEIKRDPPRWTGPSFVGKTYAEASPEFLECIAGFLTWAAGQAETKGETTSGGQLRAPYLRRDAARALGWRERLLKRTSKPERKPSLPRSAEGKHKSGPVDDWRDRTDVPDEAPDL